MSKYAVLVLSMIFATLALATLRMYWPGNPTLRIMSSTSTWLLLLLGLYGIVMK